MADQNPLDRLPARAKARLRKIAQPAWVPPMLATLTDKRFSREGWLFEPKWDGERCLAFRNGGDLQLFSRNQKRLNEKYPEITAVFRWQETSSFIADGEIVAFKNGVTSFAKLQQRMQVEHPPANLLRMVPVALCLFDLLYLDDYDTRQVPLRYRKQILRDTFDFRDSLRFTEHRETEGEAYYRQACRRRWEGLIAKNGDSEYVCKRNPRLAEIQVHARARVCYWRLYGCARGAERIRSVAGGFLPSGKSGVCGQGRNGVRQCHAPAPGQTAGATGEGDLPVCRRRVAATRRAFG